MTRLPAVMLLAVVVAQLGCMASTIKEVELPALSADAQARFATLSPEEAIADAEEKIRGAYVAEIDLYSPQYLKRAETALSQAKRAQRKRVDNKAVFIQILALERALAQALVIKNTVRHRMAEVFKLRNALDHADAEHYKKRIYDNLIDRMEELVSYIETEQQKRFEAKLPILVEDMRAFEVDTIVHNSLNAAALALDEGEEIGADKYAPKSFSKARLVYQRAENLIRADPHEVEIVRRLGREALVEAKHAFYVAKAVMVLQEVKRDAMERVVLEEERRLGQIAEVLSLRHLHDRSLDDQAAALAAAVTTLLRSATAQQVAPVGDSETAKKGEMELEESEPDFADLSDELAIE